MKTNVTLLLIAMLPISAYAQVTITGAEYYNIGDVIQMQNVAPGSANAGGAGASQVWNFGALSPSGNETIFTVQSNAGAATFPNANIVEVFSDSSKQYIRETNTDSHVLGMADNNDTTNYNNGIHIEERPFSYLSSYIDSYVVITGTVHGRGYVTVTGDSYGTLTLPSGATYNNVLRIRRTEQETDTAFTNSSDISEINTTSYLWFDNTSSAPLLRIDSINNSQNPDIDVTMRYLVNGLGIKNVNNAVQKFTAAFNDDALVVNGAFEQNKPYEMTVYNLTGQNIFASTFTSSDDVMRFDMNRRLSAGMYIVRLVDMDNAAGINVIKVVKP